LYEGEYEAKNFASTNKLYICIDGYPVASKDMMSGWDNNDATIAITEFGEDSRPYASYLDLTGSCRAIIASGLMCKVDGIHLLRPPVAELETEVSIKAARAYVPYFVPDFLYKGNNEETNLLYTGPESGVVSKDVFIGSCYNFSSPGFSNFDRGPLRNHLLVYGSPTREVNNPYDFNNIYSTRFSGSYAIAPYSSSYERLQKAHKPGTLPQPVSGLSQGAIQGLGWVYPRTTGSFFTCYQNSSTPAGSRFEVSVSSANKFIINKYGSTDSLLFTVTGHDVTLDDWNFISFKFKSTGYFANLNTGAVTCTISDGYTQTASYIKTGIDFGLIYQGVSGSPGPSSIKFGGSADVNLFNWVLPICYSGDNDIIRDYISSGDKSGRYQTLLLDQELFTGTVICPDYNYIKFNTPAQEPGDYYYSLALLNAYDTVPKLNGINAYDNKPFKVINNYYLNYDLGKIQSVFGANDSPIRIGNTVPPNAINIAKFSSQEYSVESSIASIDLSDRNSNNLNVYKKGEYLVGKQSSSKSSALKSFEGINSGIYSGRIDLTISGQVVSSDIEVSTMSITSPNSDFGYTAYYYYLIGRGERAVKIAGAFPHYTGQINEFSTGSIPDNYIANLEKIKNSISFKDRNGNTLGFDSYPYDVVVSPYSVDSLELAKLSGRSIALDNIGTIFTGQLLPDGTFTTVLITAFNSFESDSVFVHYDSYNYSDSQTIIGFKEVVNPQPVFRERREQEDKEIGRFDITLNTQGYYDLTLYGIASGYSGTL